MQRGAAFANAINRFPLRVKSSPGFLVNRVLAPYLLQAMKLHGRGVSAEDLDKAATQFGMPMGPVELADVVGLDIGLQVLGTLGGESAESERALLKGFVDAGKLGKKSGEGFYRWENGKAVKPESAGGGQSLDVDYQAGEENLAELPDSLEFKLDDLGAGEEEEDAGEGLLDSTDEVSTKLDLARAYVDMGDPGGARSILEEVLEEGDEGQRQQAQQLLDSLPG